MPSSIVVQFAGTFGVWILGASARRRRGPEPVHQPARADESDAEAATRLVEPAQHPIQVGDPGPLIDHPHDQLRLRRERDRELHGAAAAVLDRVPGHLRHGGGNPDLLLRVESEMAGDVPRALPRDHHVAVGPKRHPQKLAGHATTTGGVMRCTTTLTSSRPRVKSR